MKSKLLTGVVSPSVTPDNIPDGGETQWQATMDQFGEWIGTPGGIIFLALFILSIFAFILHFLLKEKPSQTIEEPQPEIQKEQNTSPAVITEQKAFRILKEEKQLLQNYRTLSEEKKKQLQDYITFLQQNS